MGGVWEGVSPPHWGGPPHKFFSLLDVKMATLGAFWALFLQFSYLV